MKINEIVEQNYDKLTEDDLLIWRYIEDNKLQCQSMSIQSLSKICNVSNSKITQFSKKLGLKGFGELKLLLKWNKDSHTHFDKNIIHKSFAEAGNTLKFYEAADLDAVMERLYQAQNIYLYSTGESQNLVCRQLQYSFSYLKKRMYLIQGASELPMVLNHICESDLFIIISLSGNNIALLPLLEKLNSRSVSTVGISLDHDNVLKKYCTFFLGYQASVHANFIYGATYSEFLHFYIIAATLFLRYAEYISSTQ